MLVDDYSDIYYDIMTEYFSEKHHESDIYSNMTTENVVEFINLYELYLRQTDIKEAFKFLKFKYDNMNNGQVINKLNTRLEMDKKKSDNVVIRDFTDTLELDDNKEVILFKMFTSNHFVQLESQLSRDNNIKKIIFECNVVFDDNIVDFLFKLDDLTNNNILFDFRRSGGSKNRKDILEKIYKNGKLKFIFLRNNLHKDVSWGRGLGLDIDVTKYFNDMHEELLQ